MHLVTSTTFLGDPGRLLVSLLLKMNFYKESKKTSQFIKETERKKSIAYRNFRSTFLIIWFLANIIVANVAKSVALRRKVKDLYPVLWVMLALVGIKFVSSIWSMILFYIEE